MSLPLAIEHRLEAESAIRHLDMANVRLRCPRVARYYGSNLEALQALAQQVYALQRTLEWLTPESLED